MHSGFATRSLDPVDGIRHTRLTDALGCVAVEIDGYTVGRGETIVLPSSHEQVCVPLDRGEIHLDNTRTLCHPGVACVPRGIELELDAQSATRIVVVSTVPEARDVAEVTVIDLDECEYRAPKTSSIVTARFTRPLGCRGMKVNARILQPAQHVPMHTEGSQEEVFIPVRGPASMRIDGVDRHTPVGTVTRVAPAIPRSARNEGDRDGLWVMIGAPPTGEPDEWDPGAEILE